MTDRNSRIDSADAPEDSHARLLRAQRVARMGFIDWDLGSDQILLSPEIYRLLRISADDTHPVTNEHLVAMVHPQDRPIVGEALGAAARGEIEYDIDHRMIRTDGSILWVHAQAELVRDASGRPTALLGTIVDISARKVAELALRESEARLRLALEATRIGIWDWNMRDDHWFATPIYFQMLGYEPSEYAQNRALWGERTHPEDRARVVETMETVRDHGLPEFNVEFRFRHADGSYRWVNSVGRAIEFDETGRAVRMLGLQIDITERKAAEAKLVEGEARIAHAQKLEALGQLTGGVAHDFNNLLTVILGNAEALIDALEDQPPLAQLARMIQTASERGAELTNRLLTYARRQTLEPKYVEPAEVISAMLPLLRRTLGEHIAVEANIAPETWAVHVDPGQLETAILNLFVNARDAMPSHGHLRIATTNRRVATADRDREFDAPPGDYVRITVTDTGGGIAAELLSRVFDPFFTTKEVGRGTGLGLSMVYGFAKQSGGTTQIHSQVGAGTTVSIYLPKLGAGRTAAPVRTPPPQAGAASRSETVLLVEDDDLVRAHATQALRTLGYNVIAAADGPAALAAAAEHHGIDLLLTDVMMAGGLSGPELATQIRRSRPGIAVLYTSGYADDAALRDHVRGEDAPLLRKPYDRAGLASKVRQALGTG